MKPTIEQSIQLVEKAAEKICKIGKLDFPEIRNYLLNSWNDYVNFSYCLSIWDGGAQVIQSNYFRNFVYDRRSELIFFDFSIGCHAMFMAYLYAIYNTKEGQYGYSEGQDNPRLWKGRTLTGMIAEERAADAYIENKFGFYMSSAPYEYDRIQLHVDDVLSELEQQVFGHLKIKRVY